MRRHNHIVLLINYLWHTSHSCACCCLLLSLSTLCLVIHSATRQDHGSLLVGLCSLCKSMCCLIGSFLYIGLFILEWNRPSKELYNYKIKLHIIILIIFQISNKEINIGYTMKRRGIRDLDHRGNWLFRCPERIARGRLIRFPRWSKSRIPLRFIV